ncbi:MAG: DMP19 family protein [Clostridiaceae bacterium]|jgi:predicted O-methyltransferase YrrM|nr:DMP19 family protein [Clostridiaceae bacterium]
MGFDSLSEPEKNVFIADKYIVEVNNGGFDQYFFNTDGKYASDTLSFLEKVGERNFSHLLAKALDIYTRDITEEEKLDKFDELDSTFYDLDSGAYTQFYEKMLNHLKSTLN